MAAPDNHFADFGQVKIDGHFAEFGQVKSWPYSKTSLGETGCLTNFLGYLSMPLALHPAFSDLWRSPPALNSTLTTFGCLLFLTLQTSGFLIPLLSQHSQLCCLWFPTPHCAAPVWLTRHHVMLSVARWFLPKSHLGKQRISLGVASIPSMRLCSHTQFDCNSLLIIRSWYLSMSKPKMQSWMNSHFNQLRKVIIKNCSLIIHLKKTLQYCFLKITPSKNAFQNCYHKDIFY